MELPTSMSNKTRHIPTIVGCLIMLASCQNDEDIVVSGNDENIRLAATIENTVLSRSVYTLTEPSKNQPLKAAIWASTTPRQFENLGLNGRDDDVGTVAIYTTANFTNGAEQLLDYAVYPKSGQTVYFVGLHPANGWRTGSDGEGNNGISAIRNFTGCEDLMFAPQISGSYGMNKDNWPTFKFRHLLTWLRVCIAAESEAVSNAWGKLKSLKIKSYNSVIIELNKEFDSSTCLNYYDSGLDYDHLLDFYKPGTDLKFLDRNAPSTWYTLPYNVAPQEAAYVLCAPVEATAEDSEGEKTAEYTLVIETENRSVEVPVDLMVKDQHFKGSTRRNQFILNLTFRMGNNIAVSATVSDWRAGGMGIVELDPNIPFNSGEEEQDNHEI